MKKYFLSLLFFLSTTLFGQETLKFPIEVSHSGTDIVGERLAFAVKERIRKSESMRLTYEKEMRATIILVTLDQYNDSPGNSSCYSFVQCLDFPGQPFGYYITSSVGYCGSSRVDEVAERLVAIADKEIGAILSALKQSQNN